MQKKKNNTDNYSGPDKAALAADLAAWTATASVATARAARATASASCAAVYASTARAEYWINKYEELTNVK